MDSRLLELIKDIPNNICGVYYLYNQEGNIIYIGKSINIKNRLKQHFVSKEKKEIKLQLSTFSITYENTGNELMALLRESELIKSHLPIYNRAQRKVRFFYAIYMYEDKNGYLALIYRKIDNKEEPLMTFVSGNEAKEYLYHITERYKLCQKINELYKTTHNCFQYSLKECNGACINKEAPTDYNKRVNDFLSRINLPKSDFLFQLDGRESNEKGIVLIENGVYKGFGYCPKDIEEVSEIKKFIEYKNDNKDVRKILFRHIKSLYVNSPEI